MVDNTPEGLPHSDRRSGWLGHVPAWVTRHVRSHPCASRYGGPASSNNCLKRSPSPVTPIRFPFPADRTPAIPIGKLSADRALATRRTLLSSGVPADRVDRVVGRADMDPLAPADPANARNRRITIVLLRDTQPPPTSRSVRSSQVRCPPRTIARRSERPRTVPSATCQAGPHRRQTLERDDIGSNQPGSILCLNRPPRVCRL